jgi:hypothetical protein
VPNAPWLVAYDYGQGAVWAYVRSPSRERIESDYPELMVVHNVPVWMTEVERKRLPVLDIDQPTGLLADLRDRR